MRDGRDMSSSSVYPWSHSGDFTDLSQAVGIQVNLCVEGEDSYTETDLNILKS